MTPQNPQASSRRAQGFFVGHLQCALVMLQQWRNGCCFGNSKFKFVQIPDMPKMHGEKDRWLPVKTLIAFSFQLLGFMDHPGISWSSSFIHLYQLPQFFEPCPLRIRQVPRISNTEHRSPCLTSRSREVRSGRSTSECQCWKSGTSGLSVNQNDPTISDYIRLYQYMLCILYEYILFLMYVDIYIYIHTYMHIRNIYTHICYKYIKHLP